jgi:restriction system protein
MTRQTLWSRFKRAAISTASRVVNRLRLAGLPAHRRQIARAARVLARIGTAHPAQALTYLRKVDTAVTEEAILSLFERSGTLVLRNRRYTGDGGIDGQVYIPRLGWAAIQTKRYSSAINPAHVEEFADLVARRGFAAGIFVHTGRTGPMSRQAVRGRPVFILSGEQLCVCLSGASPLDQLRLADRSHGRRSAGDQGVQKMARTSASSRLAAPASRRIPG